MNCETNMKILDVISENNQLDEWSFLASAAQKLAIKKLAAVWADDIVRAQTAGTRVSLSNPSRIIDRLLARDPKVLQAAKDQANKLVRAGKVQAGTAAVGAGYRTVAKWAEILAVIGQFVEFAKPIQAYIEYMTYAEDKLNKGDWKQEQFDAVRQEQVSILIGRLTALMAAKATMAGFAGFAGIVLKRVPGIGPAYGALSSAAQYAVLNQLVNSKEGIKAIATLFTNEYVEQVVGGLGVAAIDFVKGLIPGTDANKRKEADAKAAKDKEKEYGQAAKPAGPSVKGTAGLSPTAPVSQKKVDPKDMASTSVLRDPSALGGYRYVYERKSK